MLLDRFPAAGPPSGNEFANPDSGYSVLAGDRHDKVDKTGRIMLRHASPMHHIRLGTEHAGTTIRMLIHDLTVIIINLNTGEILRELTIDPRQRQPTSRTQIRPKKGHTPTRRRPKGLQTPTQEIRKSRNIP